MYCEYPGRVCKDISFENHENINTQLLLTRRSHDEHNKLADATKMSS